MLVYASPLSFHKDQAHTDMQSRSSFSPVHRCFRSVIEVLTLWPKSNSNGVEAIRYCGVSLTANISGVIYLDQSTFADRQRIDTVLRRAVWSDLWTSSGKSDAHTFEDLCDSADDELFTNIRTSSNHILHALLPPPSTASQNYGLRQRVHSLQLPERSTRLSDCNFLMRMLYKNSY